MFWPIVGVVVALVAYNFAKIRSTIYDVVITSMTAEWYRAVLERVPRGSRILDIGIGTGTALIANKVLIIERDLTIVGVDYDNDYVRRCSEHIAASGLGHRLSVHHASIYDFTSAEKFDVGYFSGSLMIMPDPAAALVHVAKMLTSPPRFPGGGLIYTTQTFQQSPNAVLDMLKPLLKFLTTIDFGQVTYEAPFNAMLAKAGFSTEADERLAAAGFSSKVSEGRQFRLFALKQQAQ